MLVNRQVVVTSFGIALMGALILCAGLEIQTTWPVSHELVKELGAAAFGIGVLALVWELTARRAFMREVLDSVNMAEDLEEARVKMVCWKYTLDVPWTDFFPADQEARRFF